ncbi:alpha/beta hydrolase, partial [Streptomyces sp. T-3]|nr:alpha/beta hydrolase [Streptomyces sp. T-3]
MTAPTPVQALPAAPAPRVREITLDADGFTLSGLYAEPAGLRVPRAVVVAVHG